MFFASFRINFPISFFKLIFGSTSCKVVHLKTFFFCEKYTKEVKKDRRKVVQKAKKIKYEKKWKVIQSIIVHGDIQWTRVCGELIWETSELWNVLQCLPFPLINTISIKDCIPKKGRRVSSGLSGFWAWSQAKSCNNADYSRRIDFPSPPFSNFSQRERNWFAIRSHESCCPAPYPPLQYLLFELLP